MVLTVAKLSPRVCHLCPRRFRLNVQLNRHLSIQHRLTADQLSGQQHSGGRAFTCDHCPFQSASKSVITHHIFRCRVAARQSHAPVYRCLLCHLNFATKDEVPHHDRSFYNIKLFFIGAGRRWSGIYIGFLGFQHVSCVGSANTTVNGCAICMMSKFWQLLLNSCTLLDSSSQDTNPQTQVIVKNDTSFGLLFDYKVRRHRSSQQHRDVASRQKSGAGRWRCCPHCYQTFDSLAALEQHVQHVHPLLLSRCTICGATFALKQQLSAHRYIRQKQYVRSFCLWDS